MLSDLIAKAGVWWMMPILVLTWVGLALILERLWFWGLHGVRHRRARPHVDRLLTDPLAALDRPIRTMRDATITAMSVFSANLLSDSVPTDIAEQRARDHAEFCVDASRRHLDVLTFIANLAGTLGLLGTVAGVSMSFEHLAYRNPKGLALSLSTAMYTTLGGIFLFLGTYLAVFVFGRLSDALERRLDTHLTRFGEQTRLQVESAPVTVIEEDVPDGRTAE